MFFEKRNIFTPRFYTIYEYLAKPIPISTKQKNKNDEKK